jgi:hypothetical protein
MSQFYSCDNKGKSNQPKLIIEEYKIVSSYTDTPNNMDFLNRIDSIVFKKRAPWRKPNHPITIEEKFDKIKNTLKTYDFYIVSEKDSAMDRTCYCLKRKDNILLKDLVEFWGFQKNDIAKSFILIARQYIEGEGQRKKFKSYRILYKNKKINIQEYRRPYYVPIRITPIIINDTVYKIDFIDEIPEYAKPEQVLNYSVKKNNNILYLFSVKNMVVVSSIKSFFVYKNEWILEYTDNVIINGKNIVELNDYSKAFSYSIIEKKPFYFFKKDDNINISYNNEIYITRYDEVIRYQCCEPSFFNVSKNKKMVWFYALKDGFWYYVEAGLFK